MQRRSLKTALILCAVLLASALLVHADPRFASLKLASEPDSATVKLDFTDRGKTPLELKDITPGDHVLIVSKSGHRQMVEKLTFEDGERKCLRAVLGSDSVVAKDTIKTTPEPLSCPMEIVALKPGLYTPILKNPEVLKQKTPIYPNVLKQAGITGKVYVQMLIDTTGAVINAEVAKSSGYQDFDRAAVQAGLMWKLSPALDADARPVRVWVMQTFTFKLN